MARKPVFLLVTYDNALDIGWNDVNNSPLVYFQNIFVSYLELIPASWRSKLPFGVAQEGRSYRNESQTARTSFILRMREFRQFEIE